MAMIKNKNVCFRQWKELLTKKLSANAQNTQYYLLSNPNDIKAGEPDIRYDAYVVCKENGYAWTHGKLIPYVTEDEMEAFAQAITAQAERLDALTEHTAQLETRVDSIEESLEWLEM